MGLLKLNRCKKSRQSLVVSQQQDIPPAYSGVSCNSGSDLNYYTVGHRYDAGLYRECPDAISLSLMSAWQAGGRKTIKKATRTE